MEAPIEGLSGLTIKSCRVAITSNNFDYFMIIKHIYLLRIKYIYFSSCTQPAIIPSSPARTSLRNKHIRRDIPVHVVVCVKDEGVLSSTTDLLNINIIKES